MVQCGQAQNISGPIYICTEHCLFVNAKCKRGHELTHAPLQPERQLIGTWTGPPAPAPLGHPPV